MPRIKQNEVPLFSAKSATGVSIAQDVSDYRHITVAVSATANATLTFKFQGSVRNTVPTFSSAQTPANMWDYVGAYDLEDTAFVDGDTGVSIDNDTIANNTRQYTVNVESLKWFSFQISSYTDGDFTAYMIAAND